MPFRFDWWVLVILAGGVAVTAWGYAGLLYLSM